MATPAAEGAPILTPAQQAAITAAQQNQAANYPAVASSTPAQQVTQQGITMPAPLNFGALPTAPTYTPPPVGTQGTPLDLIGIQNQLGNITNQQLGQYNGITPPNFQMPNVQVPTYNVPQPTQIQAPVHGNFLDYLRANGLDPNTFFSTNGTTPSGSNSGGTGGSYSGGYTPVTAPSVGFNAPAYNPTRTIQQRVQDLLDAEFKGQKTQLDFNEAELKTIMDAAMAGQQKYGELGDAKLKEIYDALHGTLVQGNADNAAMWTNTQDKTGQIYDKAGNAIANQSNQTLTKLAQLASALGVQAAFPEASKYGAESATNFGNLNTANRASSQQYLNEMAGHSAAYDQRTLSSSDQYGADQRAQLQSIIAANLGQMGLEKERGLTDILKNRFLISQAEGTKAPVYLSDLEDKDWERNYMVSKDSAQFGLESAKLGLQAQAMNQEMERFAQEMGFKNKQAMLDVLGKGYDYNYQDELAKYSSAKDYQDALQNWGNNKFSADMQGANLGLDINQIGNQLLQNNFQNQFNVAGAKADIFGQQRNDINTMIGAQNSNNNLTMAQNEFDLNKWGMNNDLLSKTFANQMAIYGQGASNQAAQASQDLNILQYLANRQDAATGVNQFNAQMQLDIAKFLQGNANTAWEQNYQAYRASVGDAKDTAQLRLQYLQLQKDTQLGYANLGIAAQQVNNQTAGVAQEQQRINLLNQQYNQSVREFNQAVLDKKDAAEIARLKAIMDGNYNAVQLAGNLAQLNPGTTVNAGTLPGASPGFNYPVTSAPKTSTTSQPTGIMGALNLINSPTSPSTGLPKTDATNTALVNAYTLWSSMGNYANAADRRSAVLTAINTRPADYGILPMMSPEVIAGIKNDVLLLLETLEK